MNDIFHKYEEFNMIIYQDLGISTPESCVNKPYPHGDSKKSYSNAVDKCNCITRYYEDEAYARAYCVGCYHGGFAIFYEKSTQQYFTYIIGEDDGNWFIMEGWYFDKNSFLTYMSEAFSIFNANFKEP